MDAARLVELGGKIVEISAKLNEKRAQRDALTPAIVALETELTPLLVEHSKLIASIAGVAAPPPAPVAPAGAIVEAPGVISTPVGSGVNAPLKNRVIDYLKKRQGEDPVSASDVADVLKIDATIVREAMLELRNAR